VGEALRRVAVGIGRALRLRCPRCGRAPLFPPCELSGGRAARRAVKFLRNWFAMHEVCAACDLKFERAQGYWVGAIYANYAATTLVAVAGYFLLWAGTDLSTAAQLAIWMPFCVVFPLWFFRYSRALWLAVEVGLNPTP
jgi:uncharacterized protein (DUF983 family)